MKSTFLCSSLVTQFSKVPVTDRPLGATVHWGGTAQHMPRAPQAGEPCFLILLWTVAWGCGSEAEMQSHLYPMPCAQ